ncbi:hypothetical protein [Aquipuribacter nitratireducens]|uniref:Flp pilus-assembly TadG-like N-terminal domain-containing protein n=1 Tax=Aquipuribacter nitratireducens TaxID=650104 RepID=A0ABW0GNM6_9MICO
MWRTRDRVPSGDRGDIVVGWLVRLVVYLGIIGVLAFDGISLGVARLSVEDGAAASAREASRDLVSGATVQQAYLTATAAAAADNAFNEVPAESFVVSPAGDVTVTVVRETPTLVLHHIPRSEAWLTVEATATHTRT